MPVQAHCLKLLINDHRDIYAQSQTGTGKTAAFLLGIFQLIVSEEKFRNEKALVIVPTRELAVQIEEEAGILGRYLDVKTTSVYGGVGYGAQVKKLEKGVDILIGTPGRLIDFHKQRKINFMDFKFLVIDEADRLFDMGFLPDLRKILAKMRSGKDRITMLFSATLNARVGNLAWEYMNDPDEVIIEPEKITVDTVSQELYHVGKDEKMQLLLGLLQQSKPENAVIFTNTRHSAWEVAKRMEINGYQVKFLMGDLPQSTRLKIVNQVKKGHQKFLVATDVAARGLHIDELEMVINYDVPLEPESYIHRIGRTARAGKEGRTVTMACEEYVYGLNPIEKLMGRKIPVSWADESLIVQDKSAGMSFTAQSRFRDINRKSRENTALERPNTQRSKYNREKNNRKPLDERTVKVQTTVSSVAGGMDEIADEKKSKRGNKLQNQSRSGKDKGRLKQHQKTQKQSRSRKEADNARSKPALGSPSDKVKSSPDTQRIKSGASIDERIEYYKKKYGEDFSLPGTVKGNKAAVKKKKKGFFSRLFKH